MTTEVLTGQAFVDGFSLTYIDLIHRVYPYGMTISGVSSTQYSDDGTHCWFISPDTNLQFTLPNEMKMHLLLDFINTFPGQNISVEINGNQVESFEEMHAGMRIQRSFAFSGQSINRIIIKYKLTSKAIGIYPHDPRDLVAMFYEFRVVYSETASTQKHDLEALRDRFKLSSITHLGIPQRNAELNRQEYAEGRTILKSFPSVVTLALTTFCNNKIPCMICDRNTRLAISDCEINRTIIDKTIPLLKTAMYVLLHCGGEAMLSRYFDDIISIVEPPTRVTFATNAMLMTHKRADLMLQKDIMAGFVVSMDAATAETYRIMRPGSKFETVVDNVTYYIARTKELKREHSNVTLNMTLCESNIHDAPKLVDLAESIGAWGVDYNHLNVGLTHTVKTSEGWDWNYAEQAQFKDKEKHDRLLIETYYKAKDRGINISLVGKPFIGPNASKYQEIICEMTGQVAFQESQCVDHWNSPHHKKLSPNIPSCFKPWQETIIQPNGLVRACYFHETSEWALGHLGLSDFMSIWNSDQMIAVREQFMKHSFARSCAESQPCMHRGRQ